MPVQPLPLTRACPYDPVPEHVRLREDEGPVAKVRLPNGREVWALTRLADARAMLADPRFSSNRRQPGHPNYMPGMPADAHRELIEMDPPEHTAARKAVIGEFTVKRMALLRPRVQQIVDDHIDRMLAGPKPADLVQALSLPVPSLVICEILGVPYADREFFQRRSADFLGQRDRAALGEVVHDLTSYMTELVMSKVKTPTDDLLSRQLAKGVNVEDVIGLGFLLLIAGHETTANQISLGIFTLLDKPELAAQLRAEPDRISDAIEELLRFFTITSESGSSRMALEDVEIAGVPIAAGEGVVALAHTANRDPAAFADPDKLNLFRGARNHIAFGFGAHQCLGQNLARVELEIVYNTVLRRIPDLALAAPVDELRFKQNGPIYGLYELPVTWGA